MARPVGAPHEKAPDAAEAPGVDAPDTADAADAPTTGGDTPAEVDATFRTLRRVAVGYFTVFLLAVTGVPALTLTLDWWSQGRLIGGMSPGFVMAAFGLYAFFLLIGLAAGTLSTAVESRMLGHDDHTDPDDHGDVSP